MPRKSKPILKEKRGSWFQTVIIVGVVAAGIAAALEFSGSRSISPITSILKPGCNIKGNISYNASKKIYHLPGMEDYESTVIDRMKGEHLFCSEAVAIQSGWSKASR